MLKPGLLIGDPDRGAGDDASLLVAHEAAHLPAIKLGEGREGKNHEDECQHTAQAHAILLERGDGARERSAGRLDDPGGAVLLRVVNQSLLACAFGGRQGLDAARLATASEDDAPDRAVRQ
jgi:hypothetical protein